MALPAREPESVLREPEHIRRAREVVGQFGVRAGLRHGGNMPAVAVAVAPNSKLQFGGFGQ